MLGRINKDSNIATARRRIEEKLLELRELEKTKGTPQAGLSNLGPTVTAFYGQKPIQFELTDLTFDAAKTAGYKWVGLYSEEDLKIFFNSYKQQELNQFVLSKRLYYESGKQFPYTGKFVTVFRKQP